MIRRSLTTWLGFLRELKNGVCGGVIENRGSCMVVVRWPYIYSSGGRGQVGSGGVRWGQVVSRGVRW